MAKLKPGFEVTEHGVTPVCTPHPDRAPELVAQSEIASTPELVADVAQALTEESALVFDLPTEVRETLAARGEMVGVGYQFGPLRACEKCGGAVGAERTVCLACTVRYAPVEQTTAEIELRRRLQAKEILQSDGYDDRAVAWMVNHAIDAMAEEPLLEMEQALAFVRADYTVMAEDAEGETIRDTHLVPLAEQLTTREKRLQKALEMAAQADPVYPAETTAAPIIEGELVPPNEEELVELILDFRQADLIEQTTAAIRAAYGPTAVPSPAEARRFVGRDWPVTCYEGVEPPAAKAPAVTGRRKGEEKLVTVSTALLPKAKQALEDFAQAQGVRVGPLVRQIVESYLIEKGISL